MIEPPEGYEWVKPLAVEPGPALMRRQNKLSFADLIDYNLRDKGQAYCEFEHTQHGRVELVRWIIDRILMEIKADVTIVEPGCSTGDISGPYAEFFRVIGIDVTPGAIAQAKVKWPRMTTIEAAAEMVAPITCDILVMCEFLEHIVDPKAFTKAWMPEARYAIIGHPLVGDGVDVEIGHPWAYYEVDFANWFADNGFKLREAWEFPMGYRMVLGWGERL